MTELARARNQLGSVYASTRQPQQQRSLYRQALATLESIKGKAARTPKVRFELARSHFQLSRLGSPRGGPRGGFPGGRRPPPRRGFPFGRSDEVDHHAKAVEILEALRKQYPKVQEYRFLLALCYREAPRSRDPWTALRSTDKAAKLLEELIEESPRSGNPEHRHELIKTYARAEMRGPPGMRGFTQETEKRLNLALSLSEKLVMEHPHVPDYATSQVHVLFNLAITLERRQVDKDAEAFCRRAVTLQKKLVKRFANVDSYKVWLGILQETLARFLMRRQQWKEAKTLLKESIANRESLANERGMHGFLGHAYHDLANVLDKLGEAEEAILMRAKAEKHHRGRRGFGRRR